MLTSAEILLGLESEHELQIELVRMCIAESGFDPDDIQPHDFPETGFTFVNRGETVPAEICWRARELVEIGDPKCWRCTWRDRKTGVFSDCRAGRRFVRDCNDDRYATLQVPERRPR